jgi:hypothetical protein
MSAALDIPSLGDVVAHIVQRGEWVIGDAVLFPSGYIALSVASVWRANPRPDHPPKITVFDVLQWCGRDHGAPSLIICDHAGAHISCLIKGSPHA